MKSGLSTFSKVSVLATIGTASFLMLALGAASSPLWLALMFINAPAAIVLYLFVKYTNVRIVRVFEPATAV